MNLAILGAGPGGYIAAIRAAHLGAKVTVIEKEEVGGTCLNWGCIPTKAIIASARLFAKTKNLEAFGLRGDGVITPDIVSIVERKNAIVRTQVQGIRSLFKYRGITLREGNGSLASPRTLHVRSRDGSLDTLEADGILVATGSRPYQVASFPFDGKQILSSNDILNLTAIPRSLLIVGGGIVGCEFACIFRDLGSEVSLIERLPRILATEDDEISALLEREFRKKKIRVFTRTNVDRIAAEQDGVHVIFPGGGKIVAEKALVATGRAFNSEGIGLDEVGVRRGSRGEIVVNSNLETSVPGIYAVGDVTGGLLLAHVASQEGITAVTNALGGKKTMDYAAVPSAVFTSPEIASVGLTERRASEQGLPVQTGHFQFRSLAKAHVLGEIEGFVKVVSDKKTDRVLGVHIMGPSASVLVHEAAVAIRNGLKTKDIGQTIHAHPTLSEALMEAAEDVHGDAIHVRRK